MCDCNRYFPNLQVSYPETTEVFPVNIIGEHNLYKAYRQVTHGEENVQEYLVNVVKESDIRLVQK